MERDTLAMFYSLASVYGANGDLAEAVEIFEKILAFDYHYRDVEQKLIEARDLVQQLAPIESTGGSMANSEMESPRSRRAFHSRTVSLKNARPSASSPIPGITLR